MVSTAKPGDNVDNEMPPQPWNGERVQRQLAFIARFAVAGWSLIVDCVQKLAERTHRRIAEKI
jgi:hypothetical protein